MARQFRALEAQDFKIMEDGTVVGTIRVKPSKIMWKAKNGQVWYGVSPEKFGEFAKENGRKMKH